MRTILIGITILFFNVCNVFAAEDIETLKKALQSSKDEPQIAVIHKKIGDAYIARDDYQSAADHYVVALDYVRKDLSIDERFQISQYLSWGGKRKEAIRELRLILSEDPNNIKARIHLARVLSWSGKLDEAIKESDNVLKEYPENHEALLVKANALRWRNDYRKAIPLYKKVSGKGEDFDTRLGLSYAYLSARDIKSAKETSKELKPEYSYQEKELKKFHYTLDKTIGPTLDARYSYYEDSDNNIVNRYSLGFGFWLGNWKNDLMYRYTDAEDNSRDAKAQDVSLRTYSKIAESFGIGGGIGLSRVSDGNDTNFSTWHFRTDLNVLKGTIGASVTKDTFTDIAELIENNIRVLNTTFFISQSLTDRLSFYSSYSYRDYSDSNNANDFQFSTSYAFFTPNPIVNTGYRFRYLDFNRQSRNGYFDPDDFMSHQLFISLYFETETFYGYFEPFAGHQSYRRYGEKNDDIIGGGYGHIGLNLSRRIAFEVSGEGGNYALGTAGGWNYYMVGFRLLLNL
jgi:tetratricopeptide (TPR) repeat protein